MKNNKKIGFKTITIDNEDELIISLNKNFVYKQRISCYYHYKNNINKVAREMELKLYSIF